MKSSRHDAIIEIITQYPVDTQETLSEKLRERGFNVTQATVSRDIKQLHLVKKSTESGSYRYALSSDDSQSSAKFKNIMRETVTGIRYAGTIIVIKTYTGMASAAAAAIDSIAGGLVLGTIAGDDTIFAVTESEDNARIFVAMIKDFAKLN